MHNGLTHVSLVTLWVAFWVISCVFSGPVLAQAPETESTPPPATTESPPAPASMPVSPAAPSPPPVQPRRSPQVGEDSETPRLAPAPGPRGFALELSTEGFASGNLNAGVGAGYSTGVLVVGLILQHTWTGALFDEDQFERNLTQLAVGPFLRSRLIRALDGRAELIGAAHALYVRNTNVISGTSVIADESIANGVQLALGPGVRFWIDPHIALGYTAQWTFTRVWGPQNALVGDPSAPDVHLVATESSFVGRFQILAVF
jgi:hypothetical protein